MLVITLILMGAATTLIGVLPTYAQIGIARADPARCCCASCRALSTGGEWGGAVLMAVEHAPDARRGRFGAFPQIGVPIGLLLASGVLALMTGVISPGDAFLEWGWRIPFLLSFVLIIVGIIVRRAVDESPVFKEIAARRSRPRRPILQLFQQALAARDPRRADLRGQQRRRLHDHRRLPAELRHDARRRRRPRRHGAHPGAAGGGRVRSIVWLIITFAAASVSDRIGRRNTYIIGWVAFLATRLPAVPARDTGNAWLLFLGVVALRDRQRLHVRRSRRRTSPSCSPRRSATRASRSPTRSVPSSVARSPR